MVTLSVANRHMSFQSSDKCRRIYSVSEWIEAWSADTLNVLSTDICYVCAKIMDVRVFFSFFFVQKVKSMHNMKVLINLVKSKNSFIPISSFPFSSLLSFKGVHLNTSQINKESKLHLCKSATHIPTILFEKGFITQWHGDWFWWLLMIIFIQ